MADVDRTQARYQTSPVEGQREPLSWRSIAAALSSKLAMFGLDIAWPMQLSWYNEECQRVGLPQLHSPDGATFALLVGNTKHVWEPFLSACGCHKEMLQGDDPFDAYVERSVHAVCSDAVPGLAPRTYWAHRRTEDLPNGGYVAFQRAASASGLAYLDEASHLCLHPKYGAWFSLRAILVFDGISFTGERPPALKSPLSSTTQQYLRLAVNSAIRGSSSDLSPAGAAARAAPGEAPSPEAVKRSWQKWVAVRDAPCAGHPWRFSKHQLAYHYTREKSILRRLVAAACSPRFAPARRAVELELPEAVARRLSRRSSSECGSAPVKRRSLASGSTGHPSSDSLQGVAIAIPRRASVPGIVTLAAAPAASSGIDSGMGIGVSRKQVSKSLGTHLSSSCEVESVPSSGLAGFSLRRTVTEPEPDAEEYCPAVLARVDSMGSSDTEVAVGKLASGDFSVFREALMESVSQPTSAASSVTNGGVQMAGAAPATEA